MNCQFCSEPMKRGQLRAQKDRVPYWLPEDGPTDETFRITAEKVEEDLQGILLGEAGMLMTAKRLPNSYYCKRCGCVITMLGEYAP